MIVRTVEGNIQIIKRSDFKNDLSYHTYIYKIMKSLSIKYNNFNSLKIKS